MKFGPGRSHEKKICCCEHIAQEVNKQSTRIHLKKIIKIFFFLNGCILINTKTSALWHCTVFSNNYLTISHSFADFSALVWSFQKLQHVLPPHIHSHIPNMFMFSRSCLSSCFKVSFRQEALMKKKEMIVGLEEMSGSLLHSKLIIDTRTYIWIIKHFLFKQLHVFIGSHFHAEKHTCRYQPVHHIHSHSSTFWEKVFLDLTCVLMLLLISVHLCIGQKASFWIMDKIRIAFPWTFC